MLPARVFDIAGTSVGALLGLLRRLGAVAQPQDRGPPPRSDGVGGASGASEARLLP